MTGSAEQVIWSNLPVGLGFALAHLICAYFGHYFAYRRGYLRTGYMLGMFLGPVGLLCSTLLPLNRHPAVALENQRAQSTVEDSGERWTSATFVSLIGITCLVASVSMVLRGLYLSDGALVTLAIGVIAVLFAALIFQRSEPPLYLMPALPELEEPGTRELLEWVHVRHVAARLENSSNIIRRTVLAAIICSCILGLFAWAIFAEENAGVRQRTLPAGIAMAMAAVGLLAYSVWAAFTWRACWDRFCWMYEHYFPDDKDDEVLFLDDADDEECSYLEAREVNERFQERYERIHRQIGHSAERALHFAQTTEDTIERTRRMFFLKPVAALAGAWVFVKLFISRSAQDISSGQPIDLQGFGIAVLIILALWIVANLIDWLCRRIWPS